MKEDYINIIIKNDLVFFVEAIWFAIDPKIR